MAFGTGIGGAGHKPDASVGACCGAPVISATSSRCATGGSLGSGCCIGAGAPGGSIADARRSQLPVGWRGGCAGSTDTIKVLCDDRVGGNEGLAFCLYTYTKQHEKMKLFFHIKQMFWVGPKLEEFQTDAPDVCRKTTNDLKIRPATIV